MRLIDADTWIDKLGRSFANPNYHPDLGDAFQCMESEQRNEYIYDLITDINEQPTVFDMNSLMEQLKNKTFTADLYEHGWDGQTVSYLICLGDVVEIMEGAVKNE